METSRYPILDSVLKRRLSRLSDQDEARPPLESLEIVEGLCHEWKYADAFDDKEVADQIKNVVLQALLEYLPKWLNNYLSTCPYFPADTDDLLLDALIRISDNLNMYVEDERGILRWAQRVARNVWKNEFIRFIRKNRRGEVPDDGVPLEEFESSGLISRGIAFSQTAEEDDEQEPEYRSRLLCLARKLRQRHNVDEYRVWFALRKGITKTEQIAQIFGEDKSTIDLALRRIRYVAKDCNC